MGPDILGGRSVRDRARAFYSGYVITRMLRLAGLAGLVAVTVWVARLTAHGKVPPPEGRWREMTEIELMG